MTVDVDMTAAPPLLVVARRGPILAVVAHPDDESFGLGALLAALVTAGADVRVVCLTHGEASTLGATGDLRRVRQRELAAAADRLGVADVILHDFPDGGLDGVASAVIDAVVEASLGDVATLVVFEPGGVTGHPDHRTATASAHRVADRHGLPVVEWGVAPVGGDGAQHRVRNDVRRVGRRGRCRRGCRSVPSASRDRLPREPGARQPGTGSPSRARGPARAGPAPAAERSAASHYGMMDSDAWDARYAAAELVWSAEPNRFLVEEVADLTPGRALDVACGEGRNAIWLAEHGWAVTAVDFAGVALDKAHRLAEARGVTVEWRLADVVADAAEPGPSTWLPSSTCSSLWRNGGADPRTSAIYTRAAEAELTQALLDAGWL